MDTDDVQDAGQDVRDAADSKPVRMVARAGLVAYGVVHLLVAWIAVQVALGAGGKADKSGALKALVANPGGRILLWLITIGLVALVVWQLTEAIWGHRHVQDTHRRILRQVISGAEAFLFALLAFSAGSIAAGGSGVTDSDQTAATGTLLELPGGQFLVGLIGFGIMVVGGYLIYRGYSRAFLRELDLTGADRHARNLVTRLGQVGWPALGVAYATAGVLVVIAAVTYDPGRATGLDQALKTLSMQPFGQVILLVVAFGLACFGVYCFCDARYRAA